MATKAELIAVIQGALPQGVSWAQDSGLGGYEVVESLADLFEIVSTGCALVHEGAYILTAPKAQYAYGTADVTASATATAKTLYAGAEFIAVDGRVYVSRSDTAFAAAQDTKTVNIRSKWRGSNYEAPVDWLEEYNSKNDDWSTGTAPTTVTVDSSTVMSGGSFAFLEMLGRNRGVFSSYGEPVGTLRERIRRGLNKVTPAGIQRLASQTFWQAEGLVATPPYTDVELFERQDAWAVDDDAAYDDVDSCYVPSNAWFAVFIPEIESQETIAAHDDEVAYDDEAAYDDDDVTLLGLYAAVEEAVRLAKAAGVAVDFYLGSAPDHV